LTATAKTIFNYMSDPWVGWAVLRFDSPRPSPELWFVIQSKKIQKSI